MSTAGGNLPIAGSGDVHLYRGGHDIVLTGVLFVPGLKYDLFSVPKAIFARASVTFDDTGCTIKKGEVELLAQSLQGGSMALLTDAELWHARLGHPSLFVLKKMGLPSQLPRPCVVCPQAKMTKKPHQDIKQKYKPLDRISFDLMGPVESEALGGHRYVV